MNFVSFAQNLEDVMLWRALKHINSGFYIDVGANDPCIDSVTKAFYDRGWRGINVEPLKQHHDDLVSQRPRDINLNMAAGPEDGTLSIWECDVRGWATADTKAVLAHSSDGHRGKYHLVPQKRLSRICEEFTQGDIHFLKIDVEGFEKSVIEGMDFTRFRPWILVVEATRPNTTEEVHHEWEPLILNMGYSLGYTDGLNRFYLANEQSHLAEKLRYPPNVFDHFVSAAQFDAEIRARQAESSLYKANEAVRRHEEQQAKDQAQQANDQATIHILQERIHLSEAVAQQVRYEADHWKARVDDLLGSTSWRVTAPLRWSSVGVKRASRLFLSMSMALVIKQPGLQRKLSEVLKRTPRLAHRLHLFAIHKGLAPAPETPSGATVPAQDAVGKDFQGGNELMEMTMHARRIHNGLEQAIQDCQSGRAAP